MPLIGLNEIRALAREQNLKLVASTDIEPLHKESERLNQWQEQGNAGEMKYMERPAELLTSPLRLFPQARSILAFTLNYEALPVPERKEGYGRVARYALGRDYHKVLKNKLTSFVGFLQERLGRTISYRLFSDAVPLLERAMAVKAGLGFIGKNTMLIQPGNGSFFFIAEVLSDLELKPETFPQVKGKCGSCQRCLDVCPTQAFTSAYSLDARRCISYLSIEKKTELNEWERHALGEWIFGCDLCQEVCPFNHNAIKKHQKADLQEIGAINLNQGLLSLSEVIGIRHPQMFLGRFSGTAIMRAGRESLLRNAAAVAVNTAFFEAEKPLLQCFEEDSSAIVRRYALWAYVSLAIKENRVSRVRITGILEKALKDQDLNVKLEAECLLQKI